MPRNGNEDWKTVLSFIVIGGANALVDIGVLNLFLWLLPTTNPVLLTGYNTVAYISAVINSYIWNSQFTFRRQATFRWREKIGFALQASFALLISNGAYLLGCSILSAVSWGVSTWAIFNIAKGVAMLLSSSCSFFLMKYVVFVSGRGKKRVRPN